MQSRSRNTPRALASWTRRVLAGALLVAPAAAQGNVLAFVDGQGDLRVFGDEASNQLVLLYERPSGELVVEGVGGTTVNGLAEMRPIVPGMRFEFVMGGGNDVVRFGRFDDGSCCEGRDVVFLGGEGDDTFSVGDEEGNIERVYADLGPGNDRFWGGEGGTVDELVLLGGAGDDVLEGFYSLFSAGATVELGSGADRVELREHASRGILSIDTGADADTVVLDWVFFRESISVATGTGTISWSSRPISTTTATQAPSWSTPAQAPIGSA
jgi:Ca2+-binding RTX toxin-like protein